MVRPITISAGREVEINEGSRFPGNLDPQFYVDAWCDLRLELKAERAAHDASQQTIRELREKLAVLEKLTESCTCSYLKSKTAGFIFNHAGCLLHDAARSAPEPGEASSKKGWWKCVGMDPATGESYSPHTQRYANVSGGETQAPGGEPDTLASSEDPGSDAAPLQGGRDA